ncbi:MAG: chemotaxis protein CheD [Chloroflexi bacterium]|nr:chemotaxis protein CheD [Chloroflexota bacterium]
MTVTSVTTIMVGLGEMKMSRDPEEVLACLGLGSCVAVSVFDRVAKVGAMAHVVLPKSREKSVDRAGRYADVAVPLLRDSIRKNGAVNSRLVISLVGGAQMSLAPGISTAFKIGEDNVEAVAAVLAAQGVSITASSIGGNRGRTFRLCITTGAATVSSAGQEDIEL